MMHRMLILCATFALLAASTTDVEAARWRSRGRRHPAHACIRCGKAFRPASRVYGRQEYGRRLWDLGKQKGEWPSFH